MANLPLVSDKETNLTSIQRARRKIDAEALVERLQRHIAHRSKLSNSQYNSIKLLLGKVMPDLQQMEFKGELEHNVVMGSPISPDAWANKHVIEGQAEQVSRPGSETPPDGSGQAQEPRSLPVPSSASDPISRAAAMAQEQGPPWRIGQN